MGVSESLHDERDDSRDAFPAGGTDDEKLSRAVSHAILAPSSHNSQPWLFHVEGGALELRADHTRSLPVADPHDRELVISCGAALLHLRVALRKMGEQPHVDLLPDPADPDLLARVTLGSCCEPDLTEKLLFWAIRTRRTNRHRYEPRPVPDKLIATLVEDAAAEGARLAVLGPNGERKLLAALVGTADRRQLADHDFRNELAEWVHPDRKTAQDGMPGSALGVPHLSSHVGPLVVRTFDWSRGRAARDEELALGSPVLAVLATTGDGPADWLAAGQALARVLLRATASDVVASFLNQPIEVADLRPEVAAISGGGAPQLILRLGYAKQVTPTQRRPVADVLI